MHADVVIGLGSNMGNRLNYLTEASSQLFSLLSECKVSFLYSSDAQLPENAPKDWNCSFINLAIRGKTSLSPHDLLCALHAIEQRIGRPESREIWSPRLIDLDILVYGSSCYDEDNLQIPHLHLIHRPFALWPLADVWADWRYPVKGKLYDKSALELAQTFGVSYPDETTEEKALFSTKRLTLTLKHSHAKAASQ